MNWNGKTVLVTGGTGFIGAALVRRLKELEANVVMLSRHAEGVNAIQADLADAPRLSAVLAGKTFDAVFHIAASGVTPGNSESLLHVNAEGTENLLNVLEKLPSCPIVVAGSWTEYGRHDEAMEEGMVCTPDSPYGISKLASTLTSHAWARRLKRPLTILRFFSVYGPGEGPKRLGPSVFFAHKEGRVPEIGDAKAERDWIYVDDIVEACLRAADLEDQGLILNIGRGETVSIETFVREMQQALGSTLEPTWGAGGGRPWDVPRVQASIKRLSEKLGWVPAVSLSEGVRKAILGYTEASKDTV